MKIGILTQVGNNYGNRLQNYALQEYIRSLGEDIQVYTLQRNYSRNIALAKLKKLAMQILKPDDMYIKELKRKFNSFNNNYLTIAKETVYKYYSNTKLNNIYDFFISGSDQVWNPGYTTTSKVDFAVFAPTRKRLSYAASIGLSDIPKEKRNEFGEWIDGMYALSVREKEGAKLLEKLYGKKAEVHVDPTMLLDVDQWISIEKQPKWYTGNKYVLAYFLGDQYTEIKQMIDTSHKIYNANIVHVFSQKQDVRYIHDPSEFLWLIRHAEHVLTDSFHCVLFSVLFGKSFTIFRRTGNEDNTGSRITTLLEMFGISMGQEKYLEVNKIKPDVIQPVLQSERKRSEKYLKNILNIQK